MSVQQTPDQSRLSKQPSSGADNKAIHWEEDNKPFQRLPREPRARPKQRVPALIPGLISFALIAFACNLAYKNSQRYQAALKTALLTTATPTIIALTATATEEFGPTSTPYVAPTDTVQVQPTVDPAQTGGITIGGKVKIYDTGPTGLNFRRSPSRTAQKIKNLPEGGIYEVVNGPTSADGFIWWQLKDPADGSVGWGAQNYMQATQ